LQKNLHVTSTMAKINKTNVHKLISFIKRELDVSLELLLINFISSDEIIEINKKYLNHDYSTDIITFNYSGSNLNLDGEIFISIDDAKYNSEKYAVSVSNELTRLVIHGMLHLAGYDDLKSAEKKNMKRIENNLTIKYNFPLLR